MWRLYPHPHSLVGISLSDFKLQCSVVTQDNTSMHHACSDLDTNEINHLRIFKPKTIKSYIKNFILQKKISNPIIALSLESSAIHETIYITRSLEQRYHQFNHGKILSFQLIQTTKDYSIFYCAGIDREIFFQLQLLFIDLELPCIIMTTRHSTLLEAYRTLFSKDISALPFSITQQKTLLEKYSSDSQNMYADLIGLTLLGRKEYEKA